MPTPFILVALAIVIALGIVPALLSRLSGADLGHPLAGDAGSFGSFIPELWAKKLMVALEKATVFASPLVVNSDYEGEISQMGDTVHINMVSDPTISSYTRGGTLTYEDLNTADQVLVIDQAKSFSFKVDDIDKRQAAGDVAGPAMARAAYKLRDLQDIAIEALFAGAASANLVNGGSAVTAVTGTPTQAYDNVLIPLRVELDEANVPQEGRYAVIPPWLHGRLLRDDRFVRADAAGGMGNGVQGNGFVGQAAGFNILVSNNCTLVTGDDYRISAGVPDAITFANQILETEALRLQTTFADAVRGLNVWGTKLVRPDMVATALVSQT